MKINDVIEKGKEEKKKIKVSQHHHRKKYIPGARYQVPGCSHIIQIILVTQTNSIDYTCARYKPGTCTRYILRTRYQKVPGIINR